MRTLAFILLSLSASLSFASQDALDQLNALLNDPAARQQAYAAGQERITFCQHCHGADGNSTRPHIPNLAEQNPIYLFNTFEKFANGQRVDFVMSELAKTLSPEDRINIALYYGLQKVLTQPAEEPHLQERGQVIFKQNCQVCHGSHGEGKEDMPRLAGQPAQYVIQTLENFRSKDPRRAASVMLAMTENMTDEEIHAVASYIQEIDF